MPQYAIRHIGNHVFRTNEEGRKIRTRQDAVEAAAACGSCRPVQWAGRKWVPITVEPERH